MRNCYIVFGAQTKLEQEFFSGTVLPTVNNVLISSRTFQKSLEDLVHEGFIPLLLETGAVYIESRAIFYIESFIKRNW